MSAHLHMLCNPRSPPLLLFIIFYVISLAMGPDTADVFFDMWEKEHAHHRHYHGHGNNLVEIEQRAGDKRNKKKVKETIDDKVEQMVTEKKNSFNL